MKTARFLALQRLYDRFAADGLDARRLAFGRGLAMVAEHTCGVDIKSYLRDDKAWSRADFEAARRSDYRFAYTEASWDEQRAYLDQAVSELAETDRKAAEAVLAEFAAPAVIEGVGRELRLQAGGWSIALDSASGDVAAITSPSGRTISGRDGSLIAYRYESYDAGDVIRHMETYLTHRQEWAVLDHDKPGLAQSGAALSKVFLPALEATDGAGILLSMPAEAVQKYGAPPHVMLHFTAEGDRLNLSLTLHDKPANRMPEASFLSFAPDGAGDWNFRKMGLWHRSGNIATSGGAQLQAVTSARCDLADGPLTIETFDAPLVAPQSSDFMTFCRTLPDFTAGIRFNLHNNKWGTNFPMWWQGDFQALFQLSLD